jgi:hypothetical protein
MPDVRHTIGYLAELNQGDDFTLAIPVLDEQGEHTQLVEGESLLVALYSADGHRLCHATEEDMVYDTGDDCYLYEVTHQESIKMIGAVVVEATLTDSDGVTHSPHKGKLYFEPRQNNDLL